MRTIVAAYHDMGCAGIRALLNNGFEIAAVFTYADHPGETIWFGSVAALAAQHDIPVYTPDNINHSLWVEKIRNLKPDIFFSFYYRHILGREILELPPAGALNLHGSLLPRYRGRAPLNWVLVNGEKETGVTLHYMTPRADDGDIVGQTEVAIARSDTALTLHNKLVTAAENLLAEYLPKLHDGSAPRIPQDSAQASYFGRRTPADGAIDWQQSAEVIENLVRAVTRPFPGAFTHADQRKFLIWEAQAEDATSTNTQPGLILSSKPLRIACGKGVLQVRFGQLESGVFLSGAQLATDFNLVPGLRLGTTLRRHIGRPRKQRVLILGVNGFIGNFLSERLLQDGKYEVHGMDLNNNAISRLEAEPDFYFHEGDIAIHREWIEYHVKKCDIVLPLVAIATPIEYTRNPLRVFELDFEENLRVVRHCVKYRTRVVFPSTSEVYGLCDDPEFDEDRSRLILGPINKQRWIYSCSKQLLDRVIWAYGKMEGMKFTLFRPFNWIGPRLDSLDSARIGSSRAITQLILNLVEGQPIQLIDGGEQKRCFTDVSEGVECLFRIIENQDNRCDGQIINIGNPDNEASIKELAELLVGKFEQHPLRGLFPPFAGMVATESHAYYGDGYQDMSHRRPSIRNARKFVGWTPRISLATAVDNTLDYFLRDYATQHGLRLVKTDQTA